MVLSRRQSTPGAEATKGTSCSKYYAAILHLRPPGLSKVPAQHQPISSADRYKTLLYIARRFASSFCPFRPVWNLHCVGHNMQSVDPSIYSGRQPSYDSSKRSALACNRCRGRKTKCSGLPPDPCPTCKDAGVECIYSESERRVNVPER